jgi:hypothetical protein
MTRKPSLEAEGARSASRDAIPALLHEGNEGVLAALLENRNFDESHLCLLLERKELSEALLGSIARRKEWLRSYRVRRRVAFHPHTPRLAAMRLARDLYLMDLVQLSLLPTAPAELRRLAEELLLARLPHLPLGQKLALARRGSARVAGGLLAEGHERVVHVALDNAFLTEAQVLRVLANERLLGTVIVGIALHHKWSRLNTVRAALLRHSQTPPNRVHEFLRELSLGDLRALAESSKLPANVRGGIRNEVVRRGTGDP